MKAIRIMILASLLALAGLGQMAAVDYQTPYKGQNYNVQSTMSQPMAVSPAMGFQSTSAYSGQWSQDAQQSMLNADGTVNEGMYMGGPRRVGNTPTPGGGNGPGTPTPTPDPTNQQPLSDGLLVLLAMAIMYACARSIIRKRTRALEH